MNNISRHISELLYFNDCVIVPNFGAFVSSRIAATIDTKRGVIQPPRKEIIFNKNITHNDGILANHIAQNANVDYNEASQQISDSVQYIKRQLKLNGSASLQNIGHFRAIGNDFCFIAEGSNNFLTDSYGFSALPVEIRAHRTFSIAPTSNGFRRAAASAAILIGLLLVAPETKDSELTTMYSQASLTSMFAPANITVDAETPAETAATATTTETETATQQVAPFHIIVGSFNNEADADKYIERLKSEGVDGLSKLFADRRIRIAAASFETKEEAVKHNRSVRKIKGFEKAWVCRMAN